VERDEVVIVDMEAGVEHLGRGTARNVDTLLVVTDANMKALEIAKHIHKLATNAGMQHVFLVGNRISDNFQKDRIEKFAKTNGLPVLDFIPFDQKVVEMEMYGETPLQHKESVAVRAIDILGRKLAQEI
jgi:CO dehydrogenase maturation factor